MLQPYFLLIKIYFFILKSSVSLRFIFMFWVKLRLNLQYVNRNFQMCKLDLEKTEEPEIKIPTYTGTSKKQESSRKLSTSSLLTMPKPLTGNKLWKILKKMGTPDHLTCVLRNLYAGQEATIRTGHGTTDWFQIGKAVYCHPAYLTYMQSTSWEMLGWM